jgi:PKD repeat protein
LIGFFLRYAVTISLFTLTFLNMQKLFILALVLMSASSTMAQTGPRPAYSPRLAAPTYRVPNSSFHPDPRSRITGNLQQLYQRSRTGFSASQLKAEFPGLTLGPAQPAGTAPRGAATNPGPAVLVRITAQDVNALLPSLATRGFQVVSSFPQLHFVEGYLPVAQLAPGTAGVSVLQQRGLLGVLAVLPPKRQAGRVQNQADYILEANRVRGGRPTGYNGYGVRIGVLSDSYNSLDGVTADVASGDLPASIQVLEDLPDGSDEGRAMVQLIYDIAPGAGQAFASAFTGEGGFANNIRALANPTQGNCKIIVDDVYYYAEPMFQDGVIAQAVEQVTAQHGVAYYSAAGNQADLSSEYLNHTFVPGTAGAAHLNFAPAGSTADTHQRFRIPKGEGISLSLQWSDPFYTTAGVRTDLDAYLLQANGDTVARQEDDNILSQTPVEILQFSNAATDTITLFDLVIRRRPGTANPTRVKYILFSGIPAREYATGSGTIFGHAAAVSAQAVAAAPSFNRLQPEYFTSLGAPTLLFSANGTPLPTIITRPKPDITSIDGVSTTFFYGEALPDSQDGYLFFGTSAAAPNAAAVAALLWQAEPSLTQAQVKARLQTTARDLGPAGFDNLTGVGLINAYAAIFGPVTPVAGSLIETFDGPPGLSLAWEVADRNGGRTLVRNDYGPSSAPGQLIQDGFFPYFGFDGTSEATLRLNLAAAPAGGWTLTFRQKKFAGEDDQPMPLTFSGTSDTDGVALSVDGGTTWYRLVDLTGTATTTSYQTVNLNLSTFALRNNLTLGTDVRLRFQRAGSSRVDAADLSQRGGRAFDDITVTGPAAGQTPVVLFSASASPASPICPGETVQFENATLFGVPTGYSWSFPGGTPATSTAASPVVAYATAGSYDVALTITTAGGTATRTVAGAVAVSSEIPRADFAVRQHSPLCPATAVGFNNQSRGIACATTYAWTFAGGSPATSTSPNPTVTYATAGTYVAGLTATNVNGATTQTWPLTIQTSAGLPYAETFQIRLPVTWGVLNPDKGLTWTRTFNILRKNGTRGPVLSIPLYNYRATGQRDSLQSPLLDLRAQTRATLRFDIAYAPYTSPQQYNDSLAVDVFAACTNLRLGRVYLQSAVQGLGTTAAQSNIFTPSAAGQWRQENVDLSAYVNQQVYLRFIAFNQFGNHLYLTNVRVDDGALVSGSRTQADSPALLAYPNPLAGGATLTLQLPQIAGTASIRLIDAVGRISWQAEWALSAAGPVRRMLPLPLAAGMYTILCQTADGQLFSRRVLVQ